MSTEEVPRLKSPKLSIKKVVKAKRSNKSSIVIGIFVVLVLVIGGLGVYFYMSKDKKWVSKGCFKDEVTEAGMQNDPKRAIPMYVHPVTSLEECKTIAAEHNANVIGLQNGNECWYGTDSQYDRHGAETGACPDLGGPLVNNVYVYE